MDSKAILNNKKKLNELAIQHNKLTTLVACLLNEVNTLKKELTDIRGGNTSSGSMSSSRTSDISNSNLSRNSNGRTPNFNELKAEDILKQLSVNHSIDN
jgi:hypothetical protein